MAICHEDVSLLEKKDDFFRSYFIFCEVFTGNKNLQTFS